MISPGKMTSLFAIPLAAARVSASVPKSAATKVSTSVTSPPGTWKIIEDLHHSLSLRVSPDSTRYHPDPALLGSGAHPLFAKAVAVRARTERVMKERILIDD